MALEEGGEEQQLDDTPAQPIQAGTHASANAGKPVST